MSFGGGLRGKVEERLADGRALISFESARPFFEVIEEIGKTPLPPYIRSGSEDPSDRERYQTVYARSRGAIAAPTAGLHFTSSTLDALRANGVSMAEITLHVGYGTFEPVRVDDLSEHSVMAERYSIDPATADALNSARSSNKRFVAVGTTTTRALEADLGSGEVFTAREATTALTITPGYSFRAVDTLLTNFHLPKSSLLVLVSTFGGYELIMDAYKHAVAERYRFYSYGDCMLIL
jgi:S-adenosylmethionine:tRNA ribosyltransferase-isomerase